MELKGSKTEANLMEAFAGESIEASELLAGEHVEMDVVDGLPGEFADIRHHAVSICEALLLRELGKLVDAVNFRLLHYPFTTLI